MLEGSTTNKTTLRASLVLIWLDDGPHSNQRIDKTIGPTTDHRDQSMKISSFFNTHYTRISLWNKLSQASFYLPTLQVVVQLNQLAQGYPTRILGERVVYRINQLDHEINIAVRRQPGDTSEKTFRKSRTTGMLLSSRTISLLSARRYDQMSEDLTRS